MVYSNELMSLSSQKQKGFSLSSAPCNVEETDLPTQTGAWWISKSSLDGLLKALRHTQGPPQESRAAAAM